MKTTRNSILSLAAGLLALSLPAHAFEIAIEGGMNLDSFTGTNAGSGSSAFNSESSKAALSYGAFVGFGVFPGFQLETGLQFTTRHSTYLSSGNVNEIKFTDMMIPAILRFNLLPVVSLGVGPYLGFGSGKIAFSTPSSTVEGDFDQANGVKKSDFGVVGSLRAAFPLAPTLSLLLDGRYVMGLTNRDPDAGDTVKFKDIQVLGGVSFSL